jgi:putative transposase
VWDLQAASPKGSSEGRLTDNVGDHLPKDQQAWVDRKLAAAFNHDDPTKGERACRDLAAQLEARWPDAAASLREGLEDMFTVRWLGIGGRLAASLTNTNCIESMISIARDTTRNVKRWRDGKMIKRWCAAGMLNAERSFRRLKGYRQMPTFVTWELFHRHAMLHQSHEQTNGRPTAQWLRLEAGRSGRPRPKP